MLISYGSSDVCSSDLYATFLIDSDGTTAVGQRSWLNFEHQNQISQELRLTSNNDGWFNWLLGGYYFREKANTRFYADRFNLPVPDPIGFRPFNKKIGRESCRARVCQYV